ncbi:pepsin/retropepsin-like aspartic protease family protein [Rhizosphaericola mali]|uniref:PDZ domain-containing protein n=1 Tax=Rhizosphaericola mali TaxID=2545455 RepID=A0A5P2FZW6_9BACT|nr:hypothetical protein [Rhizosphaericola mali]QES87409.1 hypothetical protein E0W69_001605 [Rhizosphaericola mali]
MKQLFLLLFCLMCYWGNAQNVSENAFRKAGKITAPTTAKTYPMHLWNDFILIDAKVNGVPGTFIWDNGLSFIALDSMYAIKAGVHFHKKKEETIIDGNEKTIHLEAQYADKVEVGAFSEEHAAVLDLNIDHGVFKNREHEISGLIGGGFSNHFNWSFDFDKMLVTISPKPIPKEGIQLKYIIDTFNNLDYFPMTINGQDIYAQVDFGMVGEVFSATDQLAPLFEGHPVVTSVGYNSISAGGLNRVDTIYTIQDNYEYTLSGHKMSELPRLELSGSETGFKIGSRYFMHYNVTINNHDSVYILSPRLTALPSKSRKAYGVFVLKKRNEMYIGRLSNNPNLNGKNVDLLQKVISINGKTAKDFYGIMDIRDYQEKLKNAGKDMVLKMEDGNVYKFTPQDDIAN